MSALNWSGTVLLVIGFALILASLIYSESRNVIDTTFRTLLGIGLGLLFIGLLIIIGGHWSIFFPKTTTNYAPMRAVFI